MASPFCFRPSPELAARIEEAAKREGLSRAQFLDRAAVSECERVENPQVVVPAQPEPARAPTDGSARADAFRAATARLGR